MSYLRKYVHEVLVNRSGGLSLPRKSVVRLTDRPDMTLNVYHGRKTTIQQQQQLAFRSKVSEFSLKVRNAFLYSELNMRPQHEYRKMNYVNRKTKIGKKRKTNIEK